MKDIKYLTIKLGGGGLGNFSKKKSRIHDLDVMSFTYINLDLYI